MQAVEEGREPGPEGLGEALAAVRDAHRGLEEAIARQAASGGDVPCPASARWSPVAPAVQCRLEAGHEGPHRGERWTESGLGRPGETLGEYEWPKGTGELTRAELEQRVSESEAAWRFVMWLLPKLYERQGWNAIELRIGAPEVQQLLRSIPDPSPRV